jgi:hypothetical protein
MNFSANHDHDAHAKLKESFTCVPLKKMALTYMPLKSSGAPRCHSPKFFVSQAIPFTFC